MNQIPVFQISETTAGVFQPPPEASEAPLGSPQAGGDVDQSLLDTLAFVEGLPGFQVTSQTRVADVYSMHLESDDIMPLFEELGRRGWTVRMTDERLLASRDGQLIQGRLSPTGADLQVGADPAQPPDPVDFSQLLSQLDSGQTIEFQVNPYRLAALLDALGEQGWRAHLTGDRLQGQRGSQRLQGSVQGSQATLQLGDGSPRKLGESPDGFAFLTVDGLQKNIQVCDSQKFIYQLGPEGLMPWLKAFAAHGFRVRTTDEHFEAWRGEEKAEGIVTGQRFFLKVGPLSCFATSDDDADLQGLLAWLLQSKEFPVLSQTRMVDTTRLKLQGSVARLIVELKRHGWTVRKESFSAVRGHYRLLFKPMGKSLRLTLSRIP